MCKCVFPITTHCIVNVTAVHYTLLEILLSEWVLGADIIKEMRLVIPFRVKSCDQLNRDIQYQTSNINKTHHEHEHSF